MKRINALLLLMAFTVFAADDKRPAVRIGTVDTQERTSPVFQNDDGDESIQVDGMKLITSDTKAWLCISVRYETRPDWLDDLTLEFYVHLPGERRSPGILFKGSVSYADIPKDRAHLAEMYIHFNSYERYFSQGEIKATVIAKVNGEIVSIDRRNSLDKPWWTEFDGPVRELINRNDTPFYGINSGDYESQRLISDVQP